MKRPSRRVNINGVAVRVYEHNNECYVPISDFVAVLGRQPSNVKRKLVLVVGELDPGNDVRYDNVRRVITTDVFLELLELCGYEKCCRRKAHQRPAAPRCRSASQDTRADRCTHKSNGGDG